VDDLHSGAISMDNTDKAYDLYYGMYCHTPEFIAEKVPYEQFRDRLNYLRKTLAQKMDGIAWQVAALHHDRLITPKPTHNHRGEPVFYLTEAAALLMLDVEEGKHKTMTPSQLRESRTEYTQFDLAYFDRRLRQAIRKLRFINYLNDKREEKIQERKAHRRELLLPENPPNNAYQQYSP
jgi:hypothetical protein